MTETIERQEFATNAAGRRVPTTVNGRAQAPYEGARVYRPSGLKQAPPIRSSSGIWVWIISIAKARPSG